MIKPTYKIQDLRQKIYLKAKSETTWRFWGMYVHICKKETLLESYKLCKGNNGSPGVDGVTFEQVEIPKNVTGEQFKLLKENLEVTISFMEEKPISIELPNNIECTIESTDAAIKNQTASSSYKPALLDCGIKINIPPFIESGEKIIIDTRTLEYVRRVN